MTILALFAGLFALKAAAIYFKKMLLSGKARRSPYLHRMMSDSAEHFN